MAAGAQTPVSETNSAGSLWQRSSPAVIAAVVYLALTVLVIFRAWVTCDHHFIYALDDTYIGMAMAKNLALHGVWGVSPFGFTSSDSSLLFPLLMAAAYRIAGVNLYAPLAISWTFGLASIFVAGRILRGYLSRKAQTLTLILFVFVALLFVVGVIGMEHSAHLLFTLMFLEFFLQEPDQPLSTRRLLSLGAITTLMVAARYEGLFLVAPAFCILALQRRWKPAFTVAIGAAIPVLSYAVFSLTHGATWLPNSVALKGAGGDHPGLLQAGSNIAARIAENFHECPELFLLLLCAAVILIALRKTSRLRVPLALILIAGCLHLCLAQVGMYYRYDAYLFAAATVAIACAFPTLRAIASKRAFAAAYLLALGSGAFLLLISAAQIHMLPIIARNIWLRQWQMGLFVEQYYPAATIAANDIGAINYLSHIHCYDLVGLANQDVFNARRTGRYTTQFLRDDAAAQHVDIAIAYDRWFGDPPGVPVGGPPLPSSWIRVGQWKLPDYSIIGDKTVSFYAVDPSQAAALRAALVRFSASLPKGVYLEPQS
ncbi:MAG TPA: hypothetical protein VME68_15920 [Acidobacteriaceae bacterium]|nr:hypothetical protein [Acidobacteriaceae bacterium]